MVNWKKHITNYGAEVLAYLLIITLGVMLVGSYWQFDTINSSYQDWMYHAFRIRRLLEVGLTSWDHVWANGINHWRGYQYLPHAITALISHFSGASITQSMIYVVTSIFIFSRVLTYSLMRKLRVNRTYSLLTTLLTFTFVQQWQMMLDFSIYTSIILIPLTIWIFIKSLTNHRSSFLLAAISSFAYLIHPLAGIVFAPLFAISILFTHYKTSLLSRITRLMIYLSISSPFFIQHLLKPYSFINPILSTATFARNTLPFPYLGFNSTYIVLLAFVWVLFIFKKKHHPVWLRWLLTYSTAGILVVLASYQGWLPHVLAQLQLSRINSFFGYIIPITIGYILHLTFGSIRSRFLSTILVIMIGITIINSIEIGSRYITSAVTTPSSPISYWFDGSLTSPLVYYSNDSEAALYANTNIRFAGSYNEHLLPSPISLRFKRLLSLATIFDTPSEHQLDLIDDYSQVLGLDYFILPTKSAFTDTLAKREGYIIVDSTSTDRGDFTLIQRTTPHHNAYLFDKNKHQDLVGLTDHTLANPTNNYSEWDKAISTLADAIVSDQLTPLDLEFIPTSQLHLEIPSDHPNSSVLITQSYDPNWQISPLTSHTIRASNLNYLIIDSIPDSFHGQIILSNNWPLWYWVVNGLSIFTFVITLITIMIIRIFRKS